MGVAPNARVGVLVPRGLDYLVAVLGTVKAGAAFVPLDTNYPADRVKYMIEDSARQPSAVVSSTAMALSSIMYFTRSAG